MVEEGRRRRRRRRRTGVTSRRSLCIGKVIVAPRELHSGGTKGNK